MNEEPSLPTWQGVERRSPNRRPDTVITMGPMLMLVLSAGLVLVCGFFFFLGYSIGSHGSQPPASSATQPPVAESSAPVEPNSGQSAGSQNLPDSPQGGQAGTASQPPQGASSSAATQDAASPTGLDAGKQADNPALSSQALPSRPPSVFMVQIAAVSEQPDADVLVSALRKHGYSVTVQRDPADGLLHVRIGPYTSIENANTMRQKLLNDGYNAVVQP